MNINEVEYKKNINKYVTNKLVDYNLSNDACENVYMSVQID